MGLSQEQIKALLGEDKPKPPQVQPQRRHINTRNTKHVTWHTESPTMKCSNKWGLHAIECGCPTVIKVNGLPLCSIHAIIKLSQMLDPPEEGEL